MPLNAAAHRIDGQIVRPEEHHRHRQERQRDIGDGDGLAAIGIGEEAEGGIADDGRAVVGHGGIARPLLRRQAGLGGEARRHRAAVQAEMPQNAKVEASDIRKARIMRRRICGSANRSATVKRASACSCAFKVAPLFSRSVAAWRCSLTRSHLSDSGIDRRIQSVSSAGTTPSRNMTRQAFGPDRIDEEPGHRGEEEADAEAASASGRRPCRGSCRARARRRSKCRSPIRSRWRRRPGSAGSRTTSSPRRRRSSPVMIE